MKGRMLQSLRSVRGSFGVFGVVLLMAFPAAPAAGQGGTLGSHVRDTIAIVGKTPITGSDFLERYELMPWRQKENKARQEYTKLEFLYSLVAEDLLALEAADEGLGHDSVTQRFAYGSERLFVRDELYKRQVRAKVTVPGDELREGLSRYAWELKVAVLGILSKEEGDLLYRKVTASPKPDSTLAAFQDSLFTPMDTVVVDFGTYDKKFEDAVYGIGRAGISKPVQSDSYGWVVLRLVDKTTNPKWMEQSIPDRAAAVTEIVKGRVEDQVARKYFTSVLHPQRAEADPRFFALLADTVYTYLTSDTAAHRMKDLFYLPPADLDRLRDSFRDSLQSVFIRTASGPMTLGQILIGLSVNEIVFPNLRRGVVEAILNNNIKTVVQNELLAREALRKNLQQSENVRHDMSVWMNSRLSHLLEQRVVDTVTVSDAELLGYYRENPGAFDPDMEVKVQEILTDSIEQALDLRSQILKGGDMAALARRYSKRKEWAPSGGVSGFFRIRDHGDLGFYASTADSGALVGPLRLQEGYSLFRVLERRTVKDSGYVSFDSARQVIRAKLLAEKRSQAMDHLVATLAKKYGVTLFEAKLRLIPVSTTNMFTWRTIGFGGRIVAVPPVAPEAGWVREWRQGTMINP